MCELYLKRKLGILEFLFSPFRVISLKNFPITPTEKCCGVFVLVPSWQKLAKKFSLAKYLFKEAVKLFYYFS
jgi:hypothetical protein